MLESLSYLYFLFACDLNCHEQLGSLLSMYGCYQYHKKAGGDKVDIELDTEQGTCGATPHGENSKMSVPSKTSGPHEQHDHLRKPAGIWGYVFQIIFQVIFS